MPKIEAHFLNDEEIDDCKSLRMTFIAICPRCEKPHSVYGFFAGNGKPKMFCRCCRQAAKRLSRAVNF